MSTIQVFVQGLEGSTKIVDIDPNATVKQLREVISEKTGYPMKEMRLIYAGKELGDGKNSFAIQDMEIRKHSTLYIVFRLKGGSQIEISVILANESSVGVQIDSEDTISQVKGKIETENSCLDKNSMTLKWAGIELENGKKVKDYGIKNDDVLMQFKGGIQLGQGFVISYKQDMLMCGVEGEANAQMPCGHVISMEGMTAFLRSLITAKQFLIRCPGFNPKGGRCNAEWKWPTCKNIGVLTSDEISEFEKGFGVNLMDNMGVQSCPVCKTFMLFDDVQDKQVTCFVCLKKGVKTVFCWKCLHIWQNPKLKDYCGNLECDEGYSLNNILSSCDVKKIGNISQVPTTRACPYCKTLIHHTTACKHMTCQGCKKKFCFSCLSMRTEQGWPQSCGSYGDPCPVAKRQKFDVQKQM